MVNQTYPPLLITDPIVGQLIAKFVANLPVRVRDLEAAQQRSDWKEVSNLAHQMAGAAGGYGFPEIGRSAARIDAQAKKLPDLVALALSISDFNSLCAAAVRGAAH